MRFPPYHERVVSAETRAKISAANKGRVVSEKNRRMLSRAHRGKVVSAETRAKMSASRKGRQMPEEWRRKIGDALRGEKCHLWRGGISYEPYCVKFSKEFRERVREFFGRRCVECGAPENGRRLSVHHVNYHKDACCAEEVVPLFVALCQSCHAKTAGNRDYWEARFTALIDEQYGGRCYLPRADCRIPIEARS